MIIECNTCNIKKTCKQFLKGFKCYYRFTQEQPNLIRKEKCLKLMVKNQQNI